MTCKLSAALVGRWHLTYRTHISHWKTVDATVIGLIIAIYEIILFAEDDNRCFYETSRIWIWAFCGCCRYCMAKSQIMDSIAIVFILWMDNLDANALWWSKRYSLVATDNWRINWLRAFCSAPRKLCSIRHRLSVVINALGMILCGAPSVVWLFFCITQTREVQFVLFLEEAPKHAEAHMRTIYYGFLRFALWRCWSWYGRSTY